VNNIKSKIIEGSYTLTYMQVYAFFVWLLSGLTVQSLWLQIVLFYITIYFLVELSNSNALLRIRSRMVSCSFIMMLCAANFLFDSLKGDIVQLCVVAGLILLLQCYHNQKAPGKMYFAFLLWSFSSLFFVQLLYFVPLLWIISGIFLQALNWRMAAASVFGLLTPYWIIMAWCAVIWDFSWLQTHLSVLVQEPHTVQPVPDTNRLVTAVFILLLAITGMMHFWKNKSDEKVRIRQLYGLFSAMAIAFTLLPIVLPQHFDMSLRLVIIMASPIVAHFFTFSSGRPANILFVVTLLLGVIITGWNLWSFSSIF